MKEKKTRSFLRNTSLYLSSTIFSVAVNLIVLPVYTRHLSPSDYGIVALFIMFGTLCATVISTNMHFSSYIYYFQFKNDLERFRVLYSTNACYVLLMFLAAGVAVNYCSGWISSFFFKGQLPAKLVLLSFISGCLEYLVLYMTQLLTAQVKSKHYAVIIIARVLINTGLSFYFIFVHSMTFMALIYAILLAQLTTIIALLVVTRDFLQFRFSWADLKMSLQLAFPLVPNSMVGLVYSSFDKTMLGKIKSTDSVGYYAFGEKFAMILKFSQDAVSKTWEPFFMNKAHENTNEAKEAIIVRFYEIAFVFMMIGLCIIYFSEEMIRLLTTKAFYPSMYVVPLYVYFYLFAVISTLAMNQIAFSKKMAYLLPTSICGVAVNILCNLILIPPYGAVGAAASIATSALFTNVTMLFFGMRLYPLPLGWGRLIRMYVILIAFTVPVYPVMMMDAPEIIKLVLKMTMLGGFFLIGIQQGYLSKDRVQYIYNKIRGMITGRVRTA